MRSAKRIEICAEPSVRANYLVGAYRDLLDSDTRLQCAIGRLSPFHAKATVDEWRAMAQQGEFEQLALALTEQHYDPLYNRQRKRRSDNPIELITLARPKQRNARSHSNGHQEQLGRDVVGLVYSAAMSCSSRRCPSMTFPGKAPVASPSR